MFPYFQALMLFYFKLITFYSFLKHMYFRVITEEWPWITTLPSLISQYPHLPSISFAEHFLFSTTVISQLALSYQLVHPAVKALSIVAISLGPLSWCNPFTSAPNFPPLKPYVAIKSKIFEIILDCSYHHHFMTWKCLRNTVILQDWKLI